MFGINRTLATVLAIIAGLSFIGILINTTVSSIRRHAAAERDIVWDRKLRALEAKHKIEKEALQNSIDTASAAERALVATEAAASSARALALEAELAKQTADPVFPQSVARELRR